MLWVEEVEVVVVPVAGAGASGAVDVGGVFFLRAFAYGLLTILLGAWHGGGAAPLVMDGEGGSFSLLTGSLWEKRKNKSIVHMVSVKLHRKRDRMKIIILTEELLSLHWHLYLHRCDHHFLLIW